MSGNSRIEEREKKKDREKKKGQRAEKQKVLWQPGTKGIHKRRYIKCFVTNAEKRFRTDRHFVPTVGQSRVQRLNRKLKWSGKYL